MKNVLIYLGLVISIVALYGFAFTISNDDDPAGKTVFVDSKCNMCHTVTSQGVESKKSDALDLSAISEELTAETLTQYLKKEIQLNEKNHKTAFKGSDEDLAKLVDWLLTLKKTAE